MPSGAVRRFDQRLELMLTDEMRERLDAEAELAGVPVAAMVRALVGSALADLDAARGMAVAS